MAIPAGIIIAWPTAASIPGGWSRVTDMDDRFPESITDSNPGTTGGGATHVHDSAGHLHNMSHTHTSAASGNATGDLTSRSPGPPTRSDALPEIHTHTVTAATQNPNSSTVDHGDWAAGSSNPAFYTVRWIVSDGNPTDFPDDSLVYFYDSTLPSGWSLVNGDKFLMGAADGENGGTASGGGTHTHATAAHTHTYSAHAHGSATSSGITSGITFREGSCIGGHVLDKWVITNVSYSRTHTSAAWGSDGAVTSSALSGGTSATNTYEPSWIKLICIENGSGSGSLEEGMIVGWLGDYDDLPNEWVLCDGDDDNETTPDLNGKFIKNAASTGQVDDTGGTAGHQNSSAGHTHTAAHTHANTGAMNTKADSPMGYRQGGEDSVNIIGDGGTGNQSHAHAAGGTSSAASNGTMGSISPTLSSTADTRPAFRTMVFLQYQPAATGSVAMFGANF